MGDDKAVVPVEQKEVQFYEDTITAVRLVDGTIFVPLRSLVERLELSWTGQRERIHRDPVLAEEARSVRVTRSDLDPSSMIPRTSDMLALPLDFIPGFLFGVNANRVKPELRERVIRYQRECYKALHEAFTSGRLTGSDIADIAHLAPEAYEALQIAEGVVKLARAHIRLAAEVFDNRQRIESLEAQMGSSDRFVTPDQAMQISQSVKVVAVELGKHSGRNEYGGVYGEFYRRFGITSYKMLPANKFEDAMSFLGEWYAQLTSELPF